MRINIPSFSVKHDPKTMGVVIDIYGEFLNDGVSRNALLERICDHCDWDLVSYPMDSNIVPRARYLIEEQLINLVDNGALYIRGDGVWVFNYKVVEKVDRRSVNVQYIPFSVGKSARHDESEETFEGSGDFSCDVD